MAGIYHTHILNGRSGRVRSRTQSMPRQGSERPRRRAGRCCFGVAKLAAARRRKTAASIIFAGIIWLIANGDLAGFLGTLIGFAIVLGLRFKKARNDLTSESSKLAKIVKPIRAQKPPSSGSVVLRCPRDGDLWQQIITDLSQIVDAAIVSAGESSPYADWEIQTLVRRLGPNKIVNLIDGAYPAPPLLRTAAILTVPAGMRWWPGEQQWRSAAVTLGSAILTSRG
jgi:hypothetical protein